LIGDEYIDCDPLGMSQGDPTVVVTPLLHEMFIGGAGIVAAHAGGMGAKVGLFSLVGRDSPAAFARKKLRKSGVEVHFYEDDSRPTTLKQRFRANGKTLLRVNHLRQHPASREIQRQILDDFKKRSEEVNLVIFSDFSYGSLPQPMVDEIISSCREKGIMMVADSQSSSQVGDISRFHGMSLLTPTEREARLAVRDFNSGLVVLAESLRKSAGAKNVFLTLGAEGILIHAATSSPREWLTDRLTAFNTAPRDVSGAGDALFACSSLAMAVGANVWLCAYLGSLAAACQVGRLGNIPLNSKCLTAEIES